MTQTKPVAVVVGAGPGNGAALSKRFAHAGYAVAALSRQQSTLAALERHVPGVRGYVCDVADPDSVAQSFGRIRSEMGPVATLLFNAGSGVFKDFDDTSVEDFESSWRVNAYGAFLCAKQAPETSSSSAQRPLAAGDPRHPPSLPQRPRNEALRSRWPGRFGRRAFTSR